MSPGDDEETRIKLLWESDSEDDPDEYGEEVRTSPMKHRSTFSSNEWDPGVTDVLLTDEETEMETPVKQVLGRQPPALQPDTDEPREWRRDGFQSTCQPQFRREFFNDPWTLQGDVEEPMDDPSPFLGDEDDEDVPRTSRPKRELRLPVRVRDAE
jgi:hypothetical protein